MTGNLRSRWIQRWLSRPYSSPRRPPARRRVRPGLEVLEDRITPTTFTPTTFADDGTANSLRGAITQANNDSGTATDTIQLAAGTYQLTLANTANKYELSNASGDLNITNTTHALVIQGVTDASGKPITIIDQTVLDRVFQIVAGDTVTFQDVVIEGGKAQGDGETGAAAGTTDAWGGGILIDGSDNVTLNNVVLQHNSADAGTGYAAAGGGIYAVSGSLTINSSGIQFNGASGGSGSSTVSGGVAEGGGIYAAGNTNIIHSTLFGNIVRGGNNNTGSGGDAHGGGLYTVGTATVTASNLSGNTLVGGNSSASYCGSALGGSVYAVGTVSITSSILTGNTLTGGNASDANGYSGGYAEGGSVFVSDAVPNSANISTSTLSGNVLTGGNSSNGRGGFAIGGGVASEQGALTVSASDLSGNTLTGGDGNYSGSAIISPDLGGEALGGGVYARDGTTTIRTSTLSDNSLTGGNGAYSGSGASVDNSLGGSASGGGVYADGTASIIASNLSANALIGGKGSVNSGTVTGITGGFATGGGVYAAKSVTITASTLAANTLTGGSASGSSTTPGLAEGGGVYLASTDNQLVNSTIADNQAIASPSASDLPLIFGGGLFIDSAATAMLTNVTVAGNTVSLHQGTLGSKSAGGGIYNFNGSQAVTLTNTIVALNSAAGAPDYFGDVSNNSSHNLIGNADGSNFTAAHGNLLGTTANPLNPQLGPLTNNGGPTPTLALLPGSPALNAGGNNAQSVTGPYDQRGAGFPRVVNGVIDIGAFEYQPPPSSPPPGGGGTTPPTPPPSLFQALLSLYLDGIEGEAFEQAGAAAFRDDFATASVLGRLLQFFGNPNLNTIEANIAFNEQYAGPFGPYVVLAGELALLQAVQPS